MCGVTSKICWRAVGDAGLAVGRGHLYGLLLDARSNIRRAAMSIIFGVELPSQRLAPLRRPLF